MTTTAEACLEAYLKEQAQAPLDKKTKKQRAALRKQVEALFADDALLLLGRAQLSSINAASSLSGNAYLPAAFISDNCARPSSTNASSAKSASTCLRKAALCFFVFLSIGA